MKKFNIYNETEDNLTKEIKIIKKVLKKALKIEKVSNVYFNIIIVDNNTIREINKTYRNKDSITDVISFALEDVEDNISYKVRMLGDIYISIDKAKEQSISYNHSLYREISFLAVHGLLHLLGYDHMDLEKEKIMFKKQELILNEAGLSRVKN